jgi:putative spermidine/putrescine transport system ATP-binding protein
MPLEDRTAAGARVEIRGLSKEFGAVRAVDQLGLTIEPGSFLTLLGPSGSGKTTTLNMIAGFETPSSGEVLVNGDSITSKPPHKRNIGMVFQNYALFPHMTAFENVAFPLRMRRTDATSIRERVHEALNIVRLLELGYRYPRQLSGGQQQRIALARALVFRPPLLLMDEPLGALDKKLREQMQIEIKHIQNQLGLTVIYVTHDQEEALTMSDRIAILNNGRLAQEGAPLEIYEHPQSRFVADFIGETNLLEGRIIAQGDGRVMDLTDVGATFGLGEVSETPGEVTVSIRPEKLWIDMTGEGGPGFDGRIEELIYVGESTKLYVQAENKPVVVREQNRRTRMLFRRGDSVRVRLNPADLVIFHSH